MSQIARFSSLISRDVFQSGDLSDETSIDLKAYFVAVKLRYESGEEYPYDLEELVPTAFTTKQFALEALKKDFTQDIDYVSSSAGLSGNPNPKVDYRLSPLTFEFMVARKSKPIFAIYHKIFHVATGSQREQPDPGSSNYSGIEAALRLTPLAIAAAAAHGFVGNHLSLSADRIIRRATNISVLDYMGEGKLVANPKGKTYNPTELGLMSPKVVSGRVMNRMLLAAALQLIEPVSMNYVPTEKANGLCEWIDTGRVHNNGAPVKQLRWFKEVLDVLFPGVEKEAA